MNFKFLLFTIIILFSIPLVSSTVVIRGYVNDSNGVMLENVSVNDTIGNFDITDSTGYYQFVSSTTNESERLQALKTDYARSRSVFDVSNNDTFKNMTMRVKNKAYNNAPGFEFPVSIAIFMLLRKRIL